MVFFCQLVQVFRSFLCTDFWENFWVGFFWHLNKVDFTGTRLKLSFDYSFFVWTIIRTRTNLSVPCNPLCGTYYGPTFEQQYPEDLRINIVFTGTFLTEYSINFLMISRVIDFLLVVLWLLMFKVWGIIGTSKIEFFNFSGTERANKLVL